MLLKAQSHVQKLVTDSSKTLFIAKALALSILIAISAQIYVPLWPVSLTLQPMAILAVGLSCQPSLAMATIIAYVLEGALGLPVFKGLAGGLHCFTGTTGGYIIGFIPMMSIVSCLKDNNNPSFWNSFKICLLAKVPLFALGVLWLSTLIGINSAIKLGFLPFLIKLPIEIAFAILSCNLIQSISKYLSLKN